MWIPGKYDHKNKTYNVWWGIFGGASKIKCYNGFCRIKGYTPFKRHGLIDTSGQVIIPFKYRSVDISKYGNNLIFAENMDEKYGILNANNEIVQPFIFTKELENPIYGNFSYFTSEINLKKALFDSNGTQILSAGYSDIIMPYNGKVPYLIGNNGLYSSLIFPDGKEMKKKYLIINTSYPDNNNNIKIIGLKTIDLEKGLWQFHSVIESKDSNYNSYVSINNSIPKKQWFALFNDKGAELLPLEYDN